MRDAALLLLVGAAMILRRSSRLPDVRAGAWVWPMPELDGPTAAGYGFRPRPVISDPVGPGKRKRADGTKRDHAGVDIMYKRLRKLADPPAGGSPWFGVPPQTPVLAAHAGRIWRAGYGPTGYYVIVDHGPLPYSTYYTHMSKLLVPKVGKELRNTIVVLAGQPLGICGASPRDAQRLVHLHFELRRGATPIDPEPDIHAWRLVKS